MARGEFRRAIKTFFVGNKRVAQGDLVRVGHELMRGREHLFERVRVKHDTPDDVVPAAAVNAAPAPVAAIAPAPAPGVASGAPEPEASG